jgi:hypothetical protein
VSLIQMQAGFDKMPETTVIPEENLGYEIEHVVA